MVLKVKFRKVASIMSSTFVSSYNLKFLTQRLILTTIINYYIFTDAFKTKGDNN